MSIGVTDLASAWLGAIAGPLRSRGRTRRIDGHDSYGGRRRCGATRSSLPFAVRVFAAVPAQSGTRPGRFAAFAVGEASGVTSDGACLACRRRSGYTHLLSESLQQLFVAGNNIAPEPAAWQCHQPARTAAVPGEVRGVPCCLPNPQSQGRAAKEATPAAPAISWRPRAFATICKRGGVRDAQ